MSKFVHLHTHSHYSLLDGLSKVDALVTRTKELGMEAVAITDHGNIYGAVEFYKKAKSSGVKAIIGVETYVAKGSRFSKVPKVDNVRFHLTLLVKNEEGYKNLVRLITASHLEGFYYKPRIDKDLLEKYHEGLICLSGCFSSEVAKLLQNGHLVEAEEAVAYYKNVFGEDYYLEVQPHTPNLHEGLIALSKKLNIPLVATQDSHYLMPEDSPTHEVLLAVQTNNRLDDKDGFSFKEFDVSFKSSEEMAKLFEHIPEAVENTAKIAEKCNFEFDLGKTLLPKYNVPDGKTPYSYLREVAESKLKERFPDADNVVRDRLDYELGVIEKTGFSDYFLIVQDFVGWAKKHGIVVGPGRGSAAGSFVSYVLGITDVDPIKYELLFERFLNPERISMPDIDLDFADQRRDEVLGYIKDKYGEDKVAQIITFGTMAARAAIRDAGRALGLPYSFCDEIGIYASPAFAAR
ncbi:MAG: DNA polymerase III subunit alpha [Candidatus Colwellbacteria bacterium]|nr:DNA polymerase III subunit alpha [Candidatus Colwellbacteria bacterium]